MKKLFALVFAVCMGVAATPATSQAVPVGLELALLVDISGSVNNTEFILQRDGYVNAFNSAAVQNAIAQIPGGIAVTYIYWSGASQQQQMVGWTHITNATQASAFATAIANAPRPFSGLTAPGSAINFTVPLFSNNGFEGERLVIDVSGDGRENSGANTAAARDAALLAGITTINGLPILTDDPNLDQWYMNNIQGGVGSFVLAANGFQDFQAAIEEKLRREIVNVVPEPATMAVFGLGALVVGGLYRRNRKTLAN